MKINRLFATATAMVVTSVATPGQEKFNETTPIVDKFSALSKDELTHVYEYNWFFLNGAGLDLKSELVYLTETDEGTLYIRSAKMANGAFPKNYGSGKAVYVELTLIEPDNTRHDYVNSVTYCTKCGIVSRNTPIITINGSEDSTVVLTYGEKVGYNTSAKCVIDGLLNYGYIIATYTEGDEAIRFYKRDILDAGHYDATLTSAEVGNNVFNPSEKVAVGYKELSRQFDITIKPKTVTYTGEVSIAPRDVDGTTSLGEVTLPTLNQSDLLEKNKNGVADTASIVISEWDLTQVAASAGTYEVKYKLGVSNPNYTLNDDNWHSTTFTINAVEGADPEPEPDPDNEDKKEEGNNDNDGKEEGKNDDNENETEKGDKDGNSDNNDGDNNEGNNDSDADNSDNNGGDNNDGSNDSNDDNSDRDGDEEDCLNVSIIIKFGNTLVVNNSDNQFTAYQWMLEGEEIEGATKQYLHQSQLSQGAYTVKVTTANGEKVSCPYTFAGTAESQGLMVYPNPAQSGNTVTVAVGQGATEVSIYSTSGALEQQFKLDGASTIKTTLPQGTHIINVKQADKSVSGMTILVK